MTSVVRGERVVAGGDVLAHDQEGRILFVRGAVPGDTVEVQLAETRPGSSFARADVVSVVDASPDRVDEPCQRRHEGCGGCDWMHVAPERQLDHKAAVLAEALVRTGGLGEPSIELGGSVPPWAYRTTVRCIADEHGRLGFRAQRSHDVVHAGGCMVAHPTLVALLDGVRASPGQELTLRTSAATGEVTAAWRGPPSAVTGLPNDVRTDRDAAVHERVASTSLRVSARSFFQSGPAAAELLVRTVASTCPELGEAGVVVDLYAGVGVFTRCAVPARADRFLVESSRPAAADAQHNCPGAHVVTGDIERRGAAARLRERAGAVDVVIADPPRRGLRRRGVASVVALGAPVLVLVSCDPVSLARDAALLADDGYELQRAVVVDLFPQTHHVEAVARFVRRDRISNLSP